MRFSEALRNEGRWTKTENGAVALNTTGAACLDFFATCGSLRETDDLRIERLFAEAYKENPLYATKIVFYNRDIKEGNGERKVFRNLLRYMAVYHPESVRPNLHLIGEYGRFDDLYALVGTPLEKEMWAVMKAQFEKDRDAFLEGKPISLLAKWIKTADASSKKTRALGIKTALELGYPVYNFKRIVRSMRKKIDIVERKMSANEWEKINYGAVPSRSMMVHREAFKRHDGERFGEYINKAVNGDAKIHASVLYPYDIIGKVFRFSYFNYDIAEDAVLEAQWRNLPNYVEPGTNALVIADTSGSMLGRPMNTAIGLALYFAERNTGAYHNMWISFSGSSDIQIVKGETLSQKIANMNMRAWGANTNLKAAFARVLDIAVKNHIDPDEMVKSLIVISDMEIDYCGDRDWTFYDQMRSAYASYGYQIPNIVFWNVNSRHDIFHADSTRKGVQLCSGQSVSTFKLLMHSIGLNPVEFMEKTLNSERYAPITVEGIDPNRQ